MLDSIEFARGRKAEIEVAKWLQSRGWFVVPSYDYSGADGAKPPRLQGKCIGFAIPDLDVAKEGIRHWVEVKLKGKQTLYRKTGVLEHGISLRLYRHYKRVQEITGTPVWLFILEQDSGKLLAKKMDVLGEPRIYEGNKMGNGGMAFWPCDQFTSITEFAMCGDML